MKIGTITPSPIAIAATRRPSEAGAGADDSSVDQAEAGLARLPVPTAAPQRATFSRLSANSSHMYPAAAAMNGKIPTP